MERYFFIILFVATAMVGQPQPASKKSVADKQAQTLISRLKATPVADIETGLPTDPFGKWFPKQVGAGPVQYEAKPCEGEAAESANPMMCVTASAKIGEARKLELTFAMQGYSGKKAGSATAKKPRCRFLVGSLGPNDPRAKFPTKLVAKLADLPPMLSR